MIIFYKTLYLQKDIILFVQTKILAHKNLKDFLQKKDEKVLPFIDHLLKKLDEHIAKGGRVLLLTLTKKSSEEITNYLVSKWYKAYYLHSEIATMERWEIIKEWPELEDQIWEWNKKILFDELFSYLLDRCEKINIPGHETVYLLKWVKETLNNEGFWPHIQPTNND